MATIFPRHNKNGTTSWRVMIRRKGLRQFITAFPTEKIAKKFIAWAEESYCLDPENFTYDHLRAIREREFFWRKRGKNV